MSRILLILIAGTFIYNTVRAQTLTVSSAQLNFGTVDEINADSLPLIIYNNMGKQVDVTNVKFYNFYGAPAFSCSPVFFTIADASSQTIWVKFSPVHNIFHNSEMVLENNGERGNVAVDLLGQGRYSKSYYDSTQNYSEENLKTRIKTLTGLNYTSLLYNNGRDSMFMTLDNKRVNGQAATSNTIECVYTGRLAVGYTSRTDCQNNYSFNTEHTFPQGLFSSMEPMQSDLHHLFPTDDVANNIRSNYPFGVVTNATWTQGGSRFDNNTNIFEPRNLQKGASARAMLYFVLRYQNFSSFLNSQESVLKQWNKNYLPAASETTRNNKIFQWQKNRNPFVDYPQLADRITSFSNTSVAASVRSFELFTPTANYGDVVLNVPSIYNLVIVNTGNQDVVLSNFNVSNSSLLTIVSGGNNITLPPGEAHNTEVQLLSAAAGAVNEQLTFQTNVSASPLVTVPVTASMVVAGLVEETSHQLNVYPMPFVNCFTISPELDRSSYTMMILSPEGKIIEYIDNSGQICLTNSNVPGGFYILSITGARGEVYRHKLVKTGN